MHIVDKEEITSHPLHRKAKSLSHVYLNSEAELLDTLMAMAEENLFVRLEFTDVFDYVVRELKISESRAGYFRRVAQRARVIPELKQAVVSGALSLSRARRIVGVIDNTTAGFWIDAAIHWKQKDLEREVSEQSPRRGVREGFVPLPGELTKLTVVISHEEEKDIERANALVCQALKAPASLQQTLAATVAFFLEKKDPVRKAQRATSSRTSKVQKGPPSPTKPQSPGQRKKPAHLAHQVNLRDGFRCAYVYKDGSRCDKQSFLEHHHVIPLSWGGENTASNISTRCFWHHRYEHLR